MFSEELKGVYKEPILIVKLNPKRYGVASILRILHARITKGTKIMPTVMSETKDEENDAMKQIRKKNFL